MGKNWKKVESGIITENKENETKFWSHILKYLGK